jgi:hypothetical protein
MRLLLLILMIALLPLRSWAAVGVPIEAQAVVLSAIKKVAGQAKLTPPTIQITQKIAHPHEACHPLTPTAAPAAASAAEPAKTSVATLAQPKSPCTSCTDCALCHTLAPEPGLGVSAAPVPSNGQRPGGKHRFDSALIGLSLKPPIA